MVSSRHGKYFTTTFPLPFCVIKFWSHLTRLEWQLLQSLLQHNLIATWVVMKCISFWPTHLIISIETILGPHLLWAPAMIIFSLTHWLDFLQMSPGIENSIKCLGKGKNLMKRPGSCGFQTGLAGIWQSLPDHNYTFFTASSHFSCLYS